MQEPHRPNNAQRRPSVANARTTGPAPTTRPAQVSPTQQTRRTSASAVQRPQGSAHAARPTQQPHRTGARTAAPSYSAPAAHSPAARKPTRRNAPRQQGNGKRFAALGLALVALVAIGFGAFSLLGPKEGKGTEQEPALTGAAPADTRLSFVAVGDNLPEAYIGAYADACEGAQGDGLYNYEPVYAHIKPYIESADLAYMKQETHIGGDDIGPRGWPSFNTTDAMANAVVNTGFDMVASASNHSYDWGYFGAVDHSRSVWNAMPVAFTGTATSDEEAAEIALFESGAFKVALLDYTYGVNGFAQADPPSYSVNFIDEERMRTDVARAKEVANVVMVAMHWGTENQFEPDADQLRYAQLLADLEVDVVLGSHPHVIGPLAWVEGESGHRTLVAYSLGNFVSRHEAPLLENELEGMLSCDFVLDPETSDVSVENVVWTPLVNHSEEGAYAVYALKDYSAETVARHRILGGLDDPLGQLRATTAEVIGDEFTIDM